ncbi:MAG: PEP-CTERM sorting domain-containing protein [Cyanobacteriota bacterium]|nr:PEP-CTERM sorting domain-containing protein [Cyanobacteriota bacterium]
MKLTKTVAKSLILASTVLAASLSAIAPAAADTAIYTWDEGIDLLADDNADDYWWKDLDNGAGNGGILSVQNSLGYHKSVTTTFDDVNNILTWDSVFQKKGDKTPQGGWLVVTDGPNPKYLEQEYAIFYMDGITGTLSAYAYNGENNSGSFQDNAFLGSWDNAVNIVDEGNERSMNFSVDVSSIFDVDNINALSANADRTKLDGDMWKGTGFGEELGIWFHATGNPNATYNEDGTLKQFTNGSSWFDSEGGSLHATQIVTEPVAAAVPEPATMSLLGIGVVGLGASSLKRRKA